MNPLTDIVVRNFRKGDRKALQHIFSVLYPALCYFAEKYLNNPGDAEDVAQEAFIELWNQHGKFESLNHVKTFLYVTAKNKCLNILKHNLIKEKYAYDQAPDISEVMVFEDHLIRAETIANIRFAVDNLPEKQKKITLFSIQGLTNREIADELNISLNTVKLQKKIAYRKLRDILGLAVLIFLK